MKRSVLVVSILKTLGYDEMVSRLMLSGIVALAVASSSFAADPAKALSFKVKSLAGEPVDMSKYDGKVVLIVNVASKCGLTGQYTGLQEIYDKYKDKGWLYLVFLAISSVSKSQEALKRSPSSVPRSIKLPLICSRRSTSTAVAQMTCTST